MQVKAREKQTEWLADLAFTGRDLQDAKIGVLSQNDDYGRYRLGGKKNSSGR